MPESAETPENDYVRFKVCGCGVPMRFHGYRCHEDLRVPQQTTPLGRRLVTSDPRSTAAMNAARENTKTWIPEGWGPLTLHYLAMPDAAGDVALLKASVMLLAVAKLFRAGLLLLDEHAIGAFCSDHATSVHGVLAFVDEAIAMAEPAATIDAAQRHLAEGGAD